MESFNESPVTEQAAANVAVSESESTVNNTNARTMTQEEQSPVTVGTEQAAGYAPVNETEEVTNNLNKADMKENSEIPVTEQATANVAVNENESTVNNINEKEMTTENEIPVTEQAAANVAVSEKEVQSSNDGKATTDSYKLPASVIKLCKDAVNDMVKPLEVEGLASKALGTYVVDIAKAYKKGKIKFARLKMNRMPKAKAIKALKEAFAQVGLQIMLLVIPAKLAALLGFEIESFDGKEIPEDELCITVVILDGQTRLEALLLALEEAEEAKMAAEAAEAEEAKDDGFSEFYAYFPFNWATLNGMLQSINLKVFSWKNSDFMTGVQCNNNIDKSDKEVFSDIQKLVDKGYNYTAACEWRILKKGIIVKNKLVKAINSPELGIDLSKADYGLTIFEEAKKKFSGDKSAALKTKTLPELVIDQWEKICSDLNQKEATTYMATFISGLDEKEVNEIVKPSSYVRGAGKKKEQFIKEQFEKSFNKFQGSNPYSKFRKNDSM